MRDHVSTDLEGAAYLAREVDAVDDSRLEDARLEGLESRELPPATRRCWDCGVASGPCQCSREFQAFEAEMEDRL